MRTGSGLAVLCIGQFFLLASGFSYSLVIQCRPCALQRWVIFSMASSSITFNVKVSPVLTRLISRRSSWRMGKEEQIMSDDQKNTLTELYELNKAVEELNKSMDGFLDAIRKRVTKNDT
jgi:hypothetical protein